MTLPAPLVVPLPGDERVKCLSVLSLLGYVPVAEGEWGVKVGHPVRPRVDRNFQWGDGVGGAGPWNVYFVRSYPVKNPLE